MTTNFEWLCENDREMLLIMMTGECARCKFDGECAVGIEIKCSSSEWLNSEYVEPDSWEKIELDAVGLSQVLSESYSCPANITNEVVNLVLRCEKLAGAE